jgi:glutamate-1-semialdehyde 2,1-aminomutase
MTQLLSKRPDQFSLGIWPGYYAKAKGVQVWDLDGNRYVEMGISGIGANILGYADDAVDTAVQKAIREGSSSSLNCPEEVELAEMLCALHPWADMAKFTRSGGEAMAVAVRIARTHTRRDKIAFCGYHGWHDWYLAANLGTEDALGEHLLSGLAPLGVPRGLKGTALPFRYNHIEDLEMIVSGCKGDLAAIVMEPIRSVDPKDGFLEGARDLADESGAVLIVDEISAGFRMNSGGAHLLLGLEPDMAVFSKAIGNGYPIGAVIGRERVMQSAQETFISSTCWTERIGPTAAMATVKKHKAVDAGPHLMAIGQKVQEGWSRIAEKHGVPIAVSGIYPLGHFQFEHRQHLSLKALFVQCMLEKGFLASNLFYPMVAHQDHHVDSYFEAADEAFALISEAVARGDIEDRLQGQPAASGFKRLA